MALVDCVARDAFYGREEGQVRPGDVVPLDENYARDLERRGLVARIDAATLPPAPATPATPAPGSKSLPPPPNKMRPKPLTKAA